MFYVSYPLIFAWLNKVYVKCVELSSFRHELVEIQELKCITPCYHAACLAFSQLLAPVSPRV